MTEAGPSPSARPLFALAAVSVLVALALLVVEGAVGCFTVDDASMAPALTPGERVLGLSVDYWDLHIAAGDLVRFVPPGAPEGTAEGTVPVLRRVVATGDEWVEIRAGSLWIGGEGDGPVASRYRDLLGALDGRPPQRVASRHLWLMADRPDAGRDSREFGQIPIARLGHRLWLRVTPWAERCHFRGPRIPGFPPCGGGRGG